MTHGARATGPVPAPGRTLDRWITALGLLNAVCHAATTLLSYGMVGVMPANRAVTEEYLTSLSRTFAFAGPAVQSYVRGQLLEAGLSWSVAGYVAIQMVPAITFLLLLWQMERHRHEMSPSAAVRLIRWAIVFAALSIPAVPVIVQDFWLSPAWGRMAIAGHNPYHEALTSAFTSGLPFDTYGLKMTYGPLWALFSAALMLIAGQHTILAALLFKVALAAAWIVALFMVRNLLAKHAPWRLCLGLAIFGWIPLGVHETVGEGHNDIFLVLCLLLWLWQLERGHPARAALFLGASVVFKYITAPLFLMHLLHERLLRRRSWLQSVLSTVPAGLFMVPVAALFFRSPQSVRNAWQMTGWHVYEPSHAVFSLLHLTGLSFLPLVKPIRLLFPAIALFLLARFWFAPSCFTYRKAVTGIITAILCSLLGHIWPWFLLWPLSLAGLEPSSRLSKWIIGATLAGTASFPFLVARFTVPANPHRFDLPSIVFQAVPLLWLILAPRRWFEDTSTGQSKVAVR